MLLVVDVPPAGGGHSHGVEIVLDEQGRLVLIRHVCCHGVGDFEEAVEQLLDHIGVGGRAELYKHALVQHGDVGDLAGGGDFHRFAEPLTGCPCVAN